MSQRDTELPVSRGGTDTRSGAFWRARSPLACGESARVFENGRLARSASPLAPLPASPADVELGSLCSSSLVRASSLAGSVESATGVSLRGSGAAAVAAAAAGAAFLSPACPFGGTTEGAGMPISVDFARMARAVGVRESCEGGELVATGGLLAMGGALGACGALLGRTGRGLTELGRGGFKLAGRGGMLTALGG
jgi:hypothetical protein